jgi:NedA-like, galactose-binding domain
MSRSRLMRTIFSVLALGWIALQLPAPTIYSQEGTQPLRVAIKVSNPQLPVTIGVPISESAKAFDSAQLGVIDAKGDPVPAQTRVLARWRGLQNDKRAPIKWLLVDLQTAEPGDHFLTRATTVNLKSITTTDTGSGFRIANSQLEVEIPKEGEGLLKRFKQGDKEMLSAPMSLQLTFPRRAILTQTGAGAGLTPDSIIVTDAALFKPGEKVRFEHTDTLRWDAAAGSSRLVTNSQNLAAKRRYRIDEGTEQQEEVEVSSAKPGDLQTATPLKFNHSAGSKIRDLSVEDELATIKSIKGQTIQFRSQLDLSHVVGEVVYLPKSENRAATATAHSTTIEESNGLRVVVRQDGAFHNELGETPPTLAFTLRYYIYADQPFVRVRVRIINHGTYGFGAYRTRVGPYPQHAILRSLSLLFPTAAPASKSIEVLSASEARRRISKKQSEASLAAGAFEITVPEFSENFPKVLEGSKAGMRFAILPDLDSDYLFEGARAKTTDFYLGRETVSAHRMTSSMNAKLDPAYIASTRAVRPLLIEKRDWAVELAKEQPLGEAATRVERMFAAGYAVEATQPVGEIPPISIFEYRLRGENGEQFGWRNFGDLAWAEGYANVHYDLPFVILREYVRTGDQRAFQLGSEMARYRADWGQYHAEEYLDRDKTWNLKGHAFYEKGDHGSFREPVPSHNWIEGMWLYWALTGDQSVRESALEASEAFLRMNFTYDNALVWGEPRWLGWPTLGLVVAHRYTGDNRYSNRARANVSVFAQTEETYGRKGYYLGTAESGTKDVQPWAWSYSLLGVIEYWRDTGDQRAANLIVRVADWLISKDSKNPPLKPGKVLPDGSYLPNGLCYFWHPNKASEDRSVALAGLSLPILLAAADITHRNDLWVRAQEIFRDYAFYREFTDSKSVSPSSRGEINFRTPHFPASLTKVYGQMGLTVADFLPGFVGSGLGSLIKKSAVQTISQNSESGSQYVSRRSSTGTAANGPVVAPAVIIDRSNLNNVALRRPAMASSTKPLPDTVGVATAANDGELVSKGRVSCWHSATNTGNLEWWQVDLGRRHQIRSIEIIFRDDQDQSWTRKNFEVRASNDLNFETSVLLKSQGEAAVPFRTNWEANVNDMGTYRYVRVQKTKIDSDSRGQSFFSLAEVRVFAQKSQ